MSNPPKSTEPTELRRRAEERLKGQRPEDGGQRTELETVRLVHELMVHQIELEMQNEQIEASHAEVAAGLALYAELYDFAPTGYLTFDREGAIRLVNLTGVRLLGVERSRLVKRRFSQFVAEGDRRAFSDFLEKVFANEAKESCEVTLPQKGSQPIVVQVEGARSADGQECRAVLLDITAHQREAAELVAANKELVFQNEEKEKRAAEMRQAFATLDATEDGALIFDPETLRFTYVNEGAVRQLGYTREELLAMTPVDIKSEFDEGKFRELLAPMLRGEARTHRFTTRHRRKDGHDLPVEINLQYIAPAREHPRFIAIVRDITERKRAEASHARLAMAVEQAAETIVITDEHGAILHANPAFEKTSGYICAEAIGQNPRILKSGKHDAAFYRRMWAVLTAGQVWTGHFINKRKNGTLYEEDVSISPVRDSAGKIVNFVAVKRDVTEQKKLEAQMRRAQRLESIGTLAGGIAHDLNNALAPIMMANELLRLEFPDTASQYLEMIQASARRGADMVKQLLTFAKGAEGERLLIQPQALLKEMQTLLKSTFPKNIELRISYGKDLRTILGDATQLHQVLLNLCVNARDAMPEGGTLTLKAESQELDATYVSTVPEAKPGHYVVWRVTDTGSGISSEVLDRIFDPFFTTKSPDKGTGLGLSTTLGIVKGHGGFIRVYSTPGQGSIFAVYLPAYGAGTSDIDLLAKTETTFRGRGETILVVDDEVAVRNVLRAVLTKLNFKVLTASDGTAALIQVAENRTELRAVITDLHMPHMDGISFVRVLKSRLPQAGVIVMSGRVEERELDEFKKLGVHAVLDKPFSQETLVEALKKVFPN